MATGQFVLSGGNSQFALSAVEKAFRKCFYLNVVAVSGAHLVPQLSNTHKAGRLMVQGVSGTLSQAQVHVSMDSLSTVIGTIPLPADTSCWFQAFGI
jgi:hypothetical protein